jgi:hypothetical protein
MSNNQINTTNNSSFTFTPQIEKNAPIPSLIENINNISSSIIVADVKHPMEIENEKKLIAVRDQIHKRTELISNLKHAIVQYKEEIKELKSIEKSFLDMKTLYSTHTQRKNKMIGKDLKKEIDLRIKEQLNKTVDGECNGLLKNGFKCLNKVNESLSSVYCTRCYKKNKEIKQVNKKRKFNDMDELD